MFAEWCSESVDACRCMYTVERVSKLVHICTIQGPLQKTLPSLANRAVRVRTGRTGPVVPLNVIRPYRAAPLGCLVRGCTCSMKVFGAYTIDCPILASISILPAASRCRAVTHNDEAA